MILLSTGAVYGYSTMMSGPRADGTLPVGMIRLSKLLVWLNLNGGVNTFDTIFWTALWHAHISYAALRVSQF